MLLITAAAAAAMTAAPTSSATSSATGGIRVESTSAPMLDGTPSLVAGEPIAPLIRLEGEGVMRLLSVDDKGAEVQAGPTSAVVTYQQGLTRIEDEVFYWRIPSPRAAAVGQLAALELHPLADGGLAIAATVAHRTNQPLDRVDHASLTLTIIDGAKGLSTRLVTWGGWVAEADGAMEYATLSTVVDCVSLTDFTGDLPPGTPIVGALTGAGGEPASDLTWILQGQAMDGSFTFSTSGVLEVSPTAIDDVKAAVEEKEWVTAAADEPEVGQHCYIPGEEEPLPGCIWTVQPVSDNPPPVQVRGGSSIVTPTWSGTWSHNGAAKISGAMLAKNQSQVASGWGYSSPTWTPGPVFRGSWDGKLLIDRLGDCEACPCLAHVTAFPRAEIQGTLDAIAAIKAQLVASVTVGQQTSSATLDVSKEFGSAGQLQLGSEALLLTFPLGEGGDLSFAEQVGPFPGPLDVMLGCGGLILVSTAFSGWGMTALSTTADAPHDPTASFFMGGRSKLGIKINPVGGPSGDCNGDPLPMPWEV